MVDAKLKKALQSDDPAIRKKAIAAIGKSLDYDALPLLANVFKTDPDGDVRQLAKKAGVYIRKNAVPDDPFEDGDDRIVDSRQVAVSAVAEQRASAAVEQAMNASVSGRNDKARQLLQKAFSLNPALMMDEYTRSLAGQVTGLAPDAAVDALSPEAQPVEIEKTPGAQMKYIFIGMIFLSGVLLLGGFFLPWLSAEGTDHSGLDILTNEDDIAVLLSQIENIAQFLETGTFNAISTSRNLTSFSPVLVAMAGAVQILAATLALFGSVKPWFWLQALGLTFAAAAGIGWMYIVTDDLVGIAGFFLGSGMGDASLSGVNSPFDLLGIGYLLCLGGLALLSIGAIGGMVAVGDEEAVM